jgi:hypothetical protein
VNELLGEERMEFDLEQPFIDFSFHSISYECLAMYRVIVILAEVMLWIISEETNAVSFLLLFA